MKISNLGRRATLLRYLFTVVVLPVLVFSFFSTAASIPKNSMGPLDEVVSVSGQDLSKLSGLASLIVDENEKEESEEKNQTEDQNSLENSKDLIASSILQFVGYFGDVVQKSSIETAQVFCTKVPLYIIFHSWKTFS